jgi:hypothetical protein
VGVGVVPPGTLRKNVMYRFVKEIRILRQGRKEHHRRFVPVRAAEVAAGMRAKRFRLAP